MMKRKLLCRLLVPILVFSICFGMGGDILFSAGAVKQPCAEQGTDGICPTHHPQHTADCGYTEPTEGSPCTHVHDDSCYVLPECSLDCETEIKEETDADGNVLVEGYTPAYNGGALQHKDGCAANGDPVLACTHVHDDTCGFVAAQEGSLCTFQCPPVFVEDENQETSDVKDPADGSDTPSDTPDVSGNDGLGPVSGDRTALLQDLDWKLYQNDTPIENTIDSTKDVKAVCSFKVPVEGDYFVRFPSASEVDDVNLYVHEGDTAAFAFPDALVFAEDSTTMPLVTESGTEIGTIAFVNENPATATITFNKMLNDTYNYDFYVSFEAYLSVSQMIIEGGETTEDVKIFDKDYTITIPEVKDKLDGSKKGKIDLKEKTVTWTVDVQRSGDASEASKNGELSGFIFTDDLSTVGEYVPDSFQVGGQAVTPTYEGAVLTYTFPDPTTGKQTITFKTALGDALYQETITVHNTATIESPDGKLTKEVQGSATKKISWISKTGAVVDGTEGSEEFYDPSERRITWTIVANEQSATITDAKIFDTLPTEPVNGLSYVAGTASWYTWNGTGWTEQGTIAPEINGKILTFSLGDISTKVKLVLTTQVEDINPTAEIRKYMNTATLKGTEIPEEGFTVTGGNSGSGEGVPIGYVPITKSVSNIDRTNNQLTWTVSVNPKNQEFKNLYTLDMIMESGDTSVKDFLEAGNNKIAKEIYAYLGWSWEPDKNAWSQVKVLDGMLNDKVSKICQGQKYVADSLNATEGKVFTATVGGKELSVIIVKDIPKSGTTTYSYKTEVVNGFHKLQKNYDAKNRVVLYEGTTYLNQADATAKIESHLIEKDKIPANAVINKVETKYTDIKTMQSISAKDGAFNYQNMTAVFRAHVNATGSSMLGSGWSVKDILPPGFELAPIVDGRDYLLYEGVNANANGTAKIVKPTVFIEDPSSLVTFSNEGQEITWTFHGDLDKAYIIYYRLKLTDPEAFFSSNHSQTFKNIAYIQQDGHEMASDYEDITVTSKVLNKALISKPADANVNGYVDWKIEYQPYGNAHDNLELRDTLPQGLELKLDANGKLDLTDPDWFKVEEGTFTVAGKYIYSGSTIALTEEMLSYNAKDRMLTFTPPDNTKAYRLTYRTGITGEPGKLTNNVALVVNGTVTEDKVSDVYTVTALSASAGMRRGGGFTIHKVNEYDKALAGAEFTLQDRDGNIIRQGTTTKKGEMMIRIFNEGTYTLRETVAPNGYQETEKRYTVVATRTDGGDLAVTVNEEPIEKGGTLTVENVRAGIYGSLKISKKVTGTAGDTEKNFTFHITLSGRQGVEYPYYGLNGAADGVLLGGQENTITLQHNQSIVVNRLPDKLSYFVEEVLETEENPYQISIEKISGETSETLKAEDGALITAIEGSIAVGQTDAYTFVNHKDTPIVPPTPPTPPTPIVPPIPEPIVPPVPTPGGGGTIDDTDNDVPQYDRDTLPDPNSPDSPEVIEVIDEEGVPLARFSRRETPEGTFEYIDEEGVPLSEFEFIEEEIPLGGLSPVPQTGDTMPLLPLCILFLTCLGGAGALTVYKRTRK